MKTLIVQLARFGDIFQTWPSVRGLKRLNPSESIHFLCRKNFASAALLIPELDRLWQLDTQTILRPAVEEKIDFAELLAPIGELIEELRAEKFDRIINLSFSPASSRLVAMIQSENTKTVGYSRTSDDFLSIPDDGSAYFYAQVGTLSANRVHLTDLFAHICGVDLHDSDLSPAVANTTSLQLKSPYIIVHPGASQAKKTLSWSKWGQVVRGLVAGWPGDVAIIGSKNEAEVATRICGVTGTRKALNLAGETDFPQLMSLIKGATLLIGADSAPIHLAALTKTPVLNLSFPAVRFWETGPRTLGSAVLKIEDESDISSDRIAALALARAHAVNLHPNITKDLTLYIRGDDGTWEAAPGSKACLDRDFEWELIQAIYMENGFPPPPNETFLRAVEQLADAHNLALEQIDLLKRNPKNDLAAQILMRVDEVTTQLGRLIPTVEPIVKWYQTEKVRIAPGTLQDVIEKSITVHQQLLRVAEVYKSGNGETERKGHDNIHLG